MSSYTLAVIGNPNSGKTTLFNDLTGARQRTGNWPGVTVERKEGQFEHLGQQYLLVDLPGTYSLDSDAPSVDEQIAREFILSHKADVVINIIDASNLERSLYLTAQLLEMSVPMLVVLNMMDVADDLGYEIDVDALSEQLDCRVVTTVASRDSGIEGLKAAIKDQVEHLSIPLSHTEYEPDIERAIQRISEQLKHHVSHAQLRWQAIQLLLEHPLAVANTDAGVVALAKEERQMIEAANDEDLDLLIADARYGFARTKAATLLTRKKRTEEKVSDRIDGIVLNRWLGMPIFLLAIYLMFTLTINFGGAFVDFFDQAAQAIFVDGLGALMSAMGFPDWLRVLLANGAGGGVQVVATFIPIIGFLYFFLSMLEDSGYMARAAFVMDQLMRRLGLPGKAFVPLIVGFGCNVPGIMAARTLEVERERVITVMMSPFMSCGARLSVYALFAAAFFPHGGQNVVFLLYVIGILAAMFTAFLLKSTMLKGKPEDFLMELPTYQVPAMKGVFLHTWSRLKGFMMDAGKYIVLMVMVINVLNSWGTDGSFGNEDSETSVLSAIGRSVTPVFEPMGIHEDNWPATVGILTGLLAKEVVVGTLDAVYSGMDKPDAPVASEVDRFQLLPALGDAFATIPVNLADSVSLLSDPLGFSVLEEAENTQEAAAAQDVDTSTFGAMSKRFDGKIGAFAYMLFILLYFPCVAATSAIKREAGWHWMGFAVVWTTTLAFLVSTVFYQLATFGAHRVQALLWVVTAMAVLFAVYLLLRFIANHYLSSPEVTDFPIPVRVEHSDHS